MSARVPRRQLIEFVRFFAPEIESGKYPYVEFDADDRSHQRLYRDPRVDLWLISWLPSQSTELHDHGGSSGRVHRAQRRADRGAFRGLTGASANGRAPPG